MSAPLRPDSGRKQGMSGGKVAGIAAACSAILLGIAIVASSSDNKTAVAARATTTGPPPTRAVTTVAPKTGVSSSAASSTISNAGRGLNTVPPVPPGKAIKGDTPCPKPTGEQRASTFAKAPLVCIDPVKAYRAVFTTSAGVVKVNLDTKRTPGTANNFVVLSRYGFYTGSSFHRTDTSVDIIQGGSPNTQSISDPGPGYTIKDEGGKFTYTEGDLVMARGQTPDSGSAQFFFSAGPNTSRLDSQGTYVTFGKIVEGLDVLKKVLASHVVCRLDASGRTSCVGGAPQPPVMVQSIAIEEA